MREVKQSKLIQADIEELWTVVTDHCNINQWLLPGAKIHLNPEGFPTRNGQGAVRVINQLGYSGAEKILEFMPPNKMTYTVIKGLPLKHHLGEVQLSMENGYTRVDWTVRFHSNIPSLNFLLGFFITRTLKNGLERLEKLIVLRENSI